MEITDKDLLDKYFAGDTEALGTIWQRHEKKIYGMLLNKTKGDAELSQDILQDGFIKAMKALDDRKYTHSGKSMGGWLSTICSNLFYDRMRVGNKMKGKIKNTDEVDFTTLLVAEEDFDWEELLSDEKNLRQLINTLSDDQRSIIIKRIYEKLPFNKIAKEEEISINTAIGRMRYALISLRKLIDSGGKINPSDVIEFRGMKNITWKDILDFLDEKAVKAEDNLKKAQNKVNLIIRVTEGIKQLANDEVAIKRSEVELPATASASPLRGGRTKYTYKEAKEYVSQLGLKTQREYQAYHEEGKIPKGIPKTPFQVYKNKGWEGWYEFLGKKKGK